MAERRADEALERLRVGGCGPDPGDCRDPTRPATGRRAAGCAAPASARPGFAPIPEVAGEVREPERRTLGQAAGQPRRRQRGAGRGGSPVDRHRLDGVGGCAERAAGASPPPNPGPGPGSGRPAVISRPRRSRSALSASVGGQIGLKLYQSAGSGRIISARASAISCVARWISAGSRRRDDDRLAEPDAEAGRRAGACMTTGRMCDRSSRRASPGRPEAPSRHRTAGPGRRRCGSPSRPAGRGPRAAAARRRSPAGCATG